MNPNQPPGPSTPGGTSLPPTPPPQRSVSDIPEDGFSFADTTVQLPPVVRVNPQPQPVPPVAQPATTPITPVQPQPVPQYTAAPQQAVQIPPMPANLMPPQQVPAVPILPSAPVQPPVAVLPVTPAAPISAPNLQPIQPAAMPVPAQPAQPAPTPQSITGASPLTSARAINPNGSFDPAQVPVHASSTPENPITATYTPQQVTHLPADIAQRINEKPMQNSGDVLRQLKHGLDGNRLKSIFSFVVFIASIFAAAFLINQFIFQSYYVEGTSMVPTLQNNDRLIISKVERTIAGVQGKPYIPERGQIVVLDSSLVGLNGQHEQLIKRVIGLPGDQVHIEAGTVIITNSQHPEGYDITQTLGLSNLLPTYVDAPIDITVPEGQVYVMGDNREQGGSYDSRAFGPISGNDIQGRLWGRILPLDKAQLY